MFKVFLTATVKKQLSKVTVAERMQMRKYERLLSETPHIGKPLSFTFLREVRIRDKRLYFLVYDDFTAVLIVGYGDKKAQQHTIDRIREELDSYYEIIRKLVT